MIGNHLDFSKSGLIEQQEPLGLRDPMFSECRQRGRPAFLGFCCDRRLICRQVGWKQSVTASNQCTPHSDSIDPHGSTLILLHPEQDGTPL